MDKTSLSVVMVTVISYDSFRFYSIHPLICQQSPKLTLTGSNKGLMLTARVYLITKLHECHY